VSAAVGLPTPTRRVFNHLTSTAGYARREATSQRQAKAAFFKLSPRHPHERDPVFGDSPAAGMANAGHDCRCRMFTSLLADFH